MELSEEILDQSKNQASQGKLNFVALSLMSKDYNDFTHSALLTEIHFPLLGWFRSIGKYPRALAPQTSQGLQHMKWLLTASMLELTCHIAGLGVSTLPQRKIPRPLYSCNRHDSKGRTTWMIVSLLTTDFGGTMVPLN